ncbi:MAG: hypothetical protein EHM58_07140 [Ignavibacteriae bacterium]|nr:MAG: hypothetical protein EHM58_07140 [Ignavibacteriota bacterium]
MKNNTFTSNVKFTLDIYSKSVLTVIACCLLLIVVNLYFKPADLRALETVQDVNIKSINGQSIWGTEIPVNLKQINGKTVQDEIPMDIKSINGRDVWGDQLPMDLKSINGISIFGSTLPVKVQ